MRRGGGLFPPGAPSSRELQALGLCTRVMGEDADDKDPYCALYTNCKLNLPAGAIWLLTTTTTIRLARCLDNIRDSWTERLRRSHYVDDDICRIVARE